MIKIPEGKTPVITINADRGYIDDYIIHVYDAQYEEVKTKCHAIFIDTETGIISEIPLDELRADDIDN